MAVTVKKQLDIFEQLRACSFDGIEFPIPSIALSGGHDIAEHKAYGRDGAILERTGAIPLQIKLKALFRNHIAPGRKETWEKLYPSQFRSFVARLQKGTAGDLVHPDYGKIRVYPTSWSTEITAQQRDGCDVDVTFKESSKTPEELEAVFMSPPPDIVDLIGEAVSLDTKYLALSKIKAYQKQLKKARTFDKGFAEMTRSIQSALDSVLMTEKQIFGMVDSVTYHISNMLAAIERLGPTNQIAMVNGLQRSANRLSSGLKGIAKTFGAKDSSVKRQAKQQEQTVPTKRKYITPYEISLTRLASQLGIQKDQLISSNPALQGVLLVPARTEVTYER